MKKLLIYFLIFLVFALGLFFLIQELGLLGNKNDAKTEEAQKEPSTYRYSGRISEVGIDYFVMNIPVMPEKIDETMLEEDFEPEFIRVLVYIPDDLELIDVNDFKYVDVPENYQGTLRTLDYVINLEDEEFERYEIAVLVKSEDSVNVLDGRKEITATYVEWSCFPEGLF
jgi:hypothetical protein